jgi:hypothetical protein
LVVLNFVPTIWFMTFGMICDVAPAAVAPSTVSRFMASWIVFTGDVCQTAVTSTMGVIRPSQVNFRTSYSTAGSWMTC